MRQVLALAVLAVLSLAGCGGGATKPIGGPQARNVTVEELVRLDKAGGSLQPSVQGHAGDEVEFVTILHHEHSATVEVTVRLTQGSGGQITATASTSAHSSTATIASPAQAGLYLIAVHYPCDLPPEPTFCPPAHIAATSNGYQLQFSYTQRTPIEIYAHLSRRAGGPHKKLRRATQAAVPPYKVIEAVGPAATASAGAANNPKLGSTAQVRSGDIVAMETRLASPISGAPQPVSISFPRGPAKSITVTASVPGRAPSRATLTGAGGSPIRITAGHFMCFLAPYPTFCPAKQAQLTSGGYRFVFDATPNTSPIRIVVRVG